MTERRSKRSEDKGEALQFLVEAIGDRCGVQTAILLDRAGRIVAGMGMPNDVMILARTARQGVWPERAQGGPRMPSFSAHAIATDDGMLYFASFGAQPESARAVAPAVRRIMSRPHAHAPEPALQAS
jgi:hypothetical protein